MAAMVAQGGLESIWGDLQVGMNGVIEQRHGMTRGRYIELYTHVYNYCTNPNNPITPTQNTLQVRSSAQLIGWQLYERVRQYLVSYIDTLLNNLGHLSDEDLLNVYIKQWEEYERNARLLDKICIYLDRHWVVREHEEGRKDNYDIYQHALILWREKLVGENNPRIINAVLSLIEKERNHDIINSRLISVFINCFVQLGTNGACQFCKCQQCKAATGTQTLSFYKEHLEKRFIEETKRFYERESKAFLQDNPVPEYMKKVETRLKEEDIRLKRYLHNSTEKDLFDTCRRVLIEYHLGIFQMEFPILLKHDKNEDMARMYSLLLHIPNAFNPLVQELEGYITKQGLDAIANLGDENENDSNQYVDTLLKVHKKYNALVVTAFTNHSLFVTSLDKACTKFVNVNSATKKTSATSNKTPELLAKYCDHLLKKSTKNMEESELEDKLDQVMVVFKYIQDKDIFEKFYSNRFALRIVQKLSASDDAEKSMISKLKQACGNEYTNKLQRMIQDTDTSKDLNNKFKQHMDCSHAPLDIDFQMNVLSSGSWPFTQKYVFSLPAELERCVNRFQGFYEGQFSGRKLNWLYESGLSKGELVTHCFKNRYTFQVSTVQMAILLHYNSSDKWSVNDLAESMKIKIDALIPVLQILVKSNLLQQEGNKASKAKTSTTSDATAITNDSMISLFTSYRNRKLRINLNVPVKKDQKAESEATHKTIVEDRKFEIEASIVRTMKMRKTLKQTELMTEVLGQLSQRFKPQVRDIRKCVENLIDREYLEREDGRRDVFRYVA